jgi:hypothetical protein
LALSLEIEPSGTRKTCTHWHTETVMGLLERFEPPAFLPDFNTIPGQLEAWHRAVSSWFDAVVEMERATIGAAPQYYNPASFDPGGLLVEQAITWNAFPKELLRKFGRDRALQLADALWPHEWYRRPPPDPGDAAGIDTAALSAIFYRPQEEYCEWRVTRDPITNKIQRITFTSEPPEYWQALFGIVPGDGIPDATFPGDSDRLLSLYKGFLGHEVTLEDLVAPSDLIDGNGELVAKKGQYNIYNKWNTTHGIIHLCAPPNSLVAEIQLGGDASVLRDDPQGRRLVEPDALICYAAYGGPNRNSDPTIGATVNALARLGAFVTLRNPVGLYMDHIDLSGWTAPDGGDVSDFIHIARGTPGMIERLVVEAPPGRKISVGDLLIAGSPIRYGGQVAECITVKLTGLANILPKPVKSPSVRPLSRASIDPFYPRSIRRGTERSIPLSPGTIEAYLNQGAVPTEPSKKPPVKKGRAAVESPAQEGRLQSITCRR